MLFSNRAQLRQAGEGGVHMARILDSIDAPDKLKLLTDEELSILATEIREEIFR